MECGFKVMYASRLVGSREFNIRLSHKHLKLLVHEYLTSKEGKGFNPRDLLLVCLRMAMRHGVISEKDYDKGRLPEVRQKYCTWGISIISSFSQDAK